MSWKQLSLSCEASQVELLEGILLGLGAEAVTCEDAEDQPILEPGVGETPLWQKVVVTSLYAIDTDVEAILVELQQLMKWSRLPEYQLTELADQPWERSWLEHFQPMSFGSRLWICPSTQNPPYPQAVNIILDPGLAFGTGTHPTTALCLRWLDQQNLSGKTVIDYGCGSGVLGIAAVKLGAKIAYGVDNDPQALTATRDNAARNQLTVKQTPVYLPEQFPTLQVDILLANILAKPLVALAPYFAQLLKPGGQFALSGILVEQLPLIENAYQSDFWIQEIATEEQWVRVSGIRK